MAFKQVQDCLVLIKPLSAVCINFKKQEKLFPSLYIELLSLWGWDFGKKVNCQLCEHKLSTGEPSNSDAN